jgi:hypothetical protein
VRRSALSGPSRATLFRGVVSQASTSCTRDLISRRRSFGRCADRPRSRGRPDR